MSPADEFDATVEENSSVAEPTLPRGERLSLHVTRLHMTAPPKVFLPVPVNLQTALMRAVKMPLPYYRYLYQQVGHRWKWVERLRMSDEALEAVLHDERTTITVLYVNGAPAGYFELYRQPDEITELRYFGLMHHALGMGIGKWFLLQALHAAWADLPQKVIVQTCTADHPRALALYQRMGFTPYATAEEEIELLSEEELRDVMQRNLAIPS